MHCKLWSKGKLTDKKDQVKELLLQFTRRRVGLRIFSEIIKKEKEKKGEAGNLLPGNRTIITTSLEGKRRNSIFLLANTVRKLIILKPGISSRMLNAEIASNLVTSKDSAKIKQKLNNKLK
jgi:hypothetical protein